jgi:type II secretory pathway component PulK
VVDEEGKINVNHAGRELLIALFEEYSINRPDETADALLIWRGDKPDADGIYLAAGYPCKKSPLAVFEELACVPWLDRQAIEPLREAVTLYGKGNVNLNTVSIRTLKVLCRGFAKKLGIDSQFADSAAEKLMIAREGKGRLKDANDLKLAPAGQEETAVINELLKNTVYQSDNFSVEARGIVSRISFTIKAVYDRASNHIIGWHES